MRLLALLVATTPMTLLVAQSTAHAQMSDYEVARETSWGLGATARYSKVSKRIQRYFVEDSPGPTRLQPGATLEFTRRTRTGIELSIGFGYDRFKLRNGYYLEKGGDPLDTGDVDYVTFDKFSWVTAEVTVVGHLRLHKLLALRYGAGVGAGYLLGEVRKTDSLCTSASLQTDCTHPDPNGTQLNEPAGLPPVLPVLNLLVGMQLRPFDFLSVNLDAGLHTVPYLGVGATLYLW